MLFSFIFTSLPQKRNDSTNHIFYYFRSDFASPNYSTADEYMSMPPVHIETGSSPTAAQYNGGANRSETGSQFSSYSHSESIYNGGRISEGSNSIYGTLRKDRNGTSNKRPKAVSSSRTNDDEKIIYSSTSEMSTGHGRDDNADAIYAYPAKQQAEDLYAYPAKHSGEEIYSPRK